MTDGAFTDGARRIIYGLNEGRCIGCGRTDLTAQHRRARGMGGTSHEAIGHPANGVPLCGSGTHGCHGWTEAHPTLALLLGWRLGPEEPALGAPFWTRSWGWRCWVMVDGLPHHAFVDEDTDLSDLPDRLAAVDRFRAARLTKTTRRTA